MAKAKHLQWDWRGLELLVDEVTLTDLAAIVALTDSTAGTPSTTTVAAIPAAVASVGADTSAATVVSVNASLAAIRNDLATLTAKLNIVLNAVK